MTKDNGGLAFPTSMDVEFLRTPAGKLQSGMTLRDWFAGQALLGLGRAWLNGGADDAMLAQFSYQVADAMLEARK